MNHDVAIVIGGQAGQGIQTIELILTRVLKRSGYHVFATKEYMSRIRGGSNSTLIRVGSEKVRANVDRIDILVPLDKDALSHLSRRITPRTITIGEKKNLPTECSCIDVPFSAIAEEIGSGIYSNAVAIGTVLGILDADLDVMRHYLEEHFSGKGQDVAAKNVRAGEEGFRIGGALRTSGKAAFSVERHPGIAGELLVSGAQAVALGAISGGCRFVASYPMSPSTSVLTYLAAHDARFGIIAEQAEDEIAAVNLAIGAWYAGGRAMVTTSGGGFALMGEGISLAGMTETPLVVHVAQRPGPATGMATRTEQADLDLILYSGHGEFPRVIYAPGTTEDAFSLTHRAFDIADRYQIPVFVLTDEYFMDSYYSTASLGAGNLDVTDCFVKTSGTYARYRITSDGVSPRGIPGFGDGVVAVDSHEHTEDGHITEEIEIRNAMMEKRMGKLDAILAQSVSPTLTGPENYSVLVVGWGSNYHIIEEAVRRLGKDYISHLHFSQVYPLPPETRHYLQKAGMVIVVENNYSGQFARLLRTHAGLAGELSIRQFDGRPFCSEYLARRILKLARRVKK